MSVEIFMKVMNEDVRIVENITGLTKGRAKRGHPEEGAGGEIEQRSERDDRPDAALE